MAFILNPVVFLSYAFALASAVRRARNSVQVANTSTTSDCIDILLIGDYGARSSQQVRVARGMARVAASSDPLAILGIGDNIYPDGAEGSYTLLKSWWSDIYLPHSSLRRPWHIVTGNHDWYTDGRVQVDFTGSSQNNGGYWQFPALWYKRSFSSAGVSADFFFIDTMIWRKSSRVGRYMNTDRAYTNQRNWLISELSASASDWRVVVGHHPVYSAGSHGITSELLNDLDPIMRRYNAPIFICGHDHSKQLIQYRGMHYIVSGAGGKSSRTPSNEYPDGALKEFIRDGGFAGLTICDASKATVKYYAEDGRVQATRELDNEQPQLPSPAPTPPSGSRRRRRRRRRL